MRFWTVIQIGGAMLSGAYSAYSIASQVFPIPPTPSLDKPPWFTILIAFLIFVAFVIWGWGSTAWKLHQSEKENSHIVEARRTHFAQIAHLLESWKEYLDLASRIPRHFDFDYEIENERLFSRALQHCSSVGSTFPSQ
jgi:hypothetical protein